LGFLVSSGLTTFAWFILNLLGIPYTITSYLLLVWSVTSILFLINFITKKFNFSNFNLKTEISKIWALPLWMKILILFLLAILISVLVNDIYWPVKDWDSLVLYEYRAKIFADTGFMTDGVARGYFFNYPLLTSLNHTWIYLTGIINPMFYYFLLYMSFIVVFYFCLKRYVSRELSLIGAVFLAVVPDILQHSQMAYTNLPYTIYLVLSYIYLYIWINNRKLGTLVTSSILLALSTWTRSSEPFWLIPIFLLIIYAFWKRRPIPIFVYMGIFFPIQRIWNIFQAGIIGKESSTSEMITFSLLTLTRNIDLNRAGEVFIYLYNNVFATWGVLGVVYLLTFTIYMFRSKKDKRVVFLLLTLFSLVLLYFSTYIITYTQIDWKGIPDSARRMSIFFPPLFVFGTFLFIDDFWKLLITESK